MPRTQRIVMFDGSSDDSSNATSTAVFVGDSDDPIVVSWATDVAVASRLTLQASTDDGFDSAVAEASWTTYLGTANQGVSWLSAGPRWMRAIRNPSNESLSIVVATFQNTL